MGKPDEFDRRLKAYLHRGASTPPPAGMDARIIARAPRRKVGWALQLAAAAAVLVLAIGLGIVVQRARQSSVGTPMPSSVASPSTKPTPYPTPTTKATAYPLLPPASMHMVNRSTGWAAGTGTILRTSDGGSHWDDVSPRLARAGTWITFFLDGNNAWLASSLQPGSSSPDFSVTIYRTADGGRSWQQPGAAAADQGWPASMDFIDAAHGWLFLNLGSAAGSQGVALYGTADGGTTWTKLSEADTSGSPGHLPLRCSKGAPVFLNSWTGWIPGACNAGGGPFLFVTHDGGRTWNDVSIAMPAGYGGSCMCGISSLRFSDFSKTGVFVLDIYGTDGAAHNFLYVTADSGTSWLHGWTLPPNCFTADFIGAVGWTLDAKSNTILYTSDGGQHWSTLGTVPSSQGVVDLQFVNSAIGWAMGSEPAGNTLIKTSDGGRTWTIQLGP